MLKPIESMTAARTGEERENHDALIANGNYIAVVDAVQARGWRAWEGKPAGIFARDIIVSAIKNLAPDLEAAEVVRMLEEKLQEETARAMEGMDDDEIYAYPQARVLIYSNSRHEIWRLGDSPYVVQGELHYERSAGIEAAVAKRVEVTNHFLDNNRTDLKDMIDNDYGRSAAMELIVAEERRVEDAGEILTGRLDANVEKIVANVEVVPVEVDQEIILASDGFPKILPTLDESEDFLATIRAKDPLFVNEYQALRGAKDDETSYDDRTYVRFVVE